MEVPDPGSAELPANTKQYTYMMTKVIFNVTRVNRRCSGLSLWKYSFELVTKELDLTKKKKQALDDLYGSDRISGSTYDYLAKELTDASADLEGHLRTLMDKMTARAKELEEQVNTLELFLASLEIHYVAGDVDEETYGKQNNAILLGLEATREELGSIKSSLSEVVSGAAETPTVPTIKAEPVVSTSSEVTEIEEETVADIEEPSATEPVEPWGPTTTENTPIETIESDVPSLSAPTEEPSEESTTETETSF